MTEPAQPQEPPSSSNQPGGHEPPQPQQYQRPQEYQQPPQYQQPQSNYGSPMEQPAYAPSPSGAVGAAEPYSELVGRQLTADEKTWSMLAHLGGIVLGFLAPLIVMLTKGNESRYTRYHAVEALNFQIALVIGYVISFILMFLLIGFVLFPVLYIANIVFCVLAGIAANKGEAYKYPVTLRLVK